jgi:uncharacterized protein (TIGR03792 family)
MKNIFNLKEKLIHFCIIFIFLIVMMFQNSFQYAEAINMKNYQDEIVTEELRLQVPFELRDVWLNAEKKIWEPWLMSKDGFLGRQIYWDKEKEEALILVNWKNKKLWKSISMKEVNDLQEKFEEDVKSNLKVTKNPFTLIYEGELEKQG